MANIGIERYTKTTNTMLTVPFLAFHWLDEDEEIKFFDIINTKAKGIGTSLSRFLKRESDNLSWIATQLIIDPNSPLYNKGTLIGKRTKEKHITLQNVYNFLLLLIKNTKIAELPKEKILNITLTYFNCFKELLPVEWSDYKQYRLTHIVCLNALAIAGNKIIPSNYNFVSNQLNIKEVTKKLSSIKVFDWSSEGTLKYLKGASGSKLLAEDIIASLEK
ncbi:hypothetical protein CN563_11760 [Bacillus sp. AFS026049]|uniref:DGQHR domain-containing protein n=1 Tax=Peribacillus frigoritolerans TaxID=450367 RepID=UPI000BF8FC7E|nr:hypothetical protein CN563_11760 [Bacillus sp. AFS026049]